MSTSEPKEPQDIEQREVKGQTAVYNAHVDVSAVDEVKLVRKLDWWLLPWLSLLYLLSFLDRTSIGNAKVHHKVPFIDHNFDPLFDSSTTSRLICALVTRNTYCASPSFISPTPSSKYVTPLLVGPFRILTDLIGPK